MRALALTVLLPALALGSELPQNEARRAQMETARAEVASQFQLQAFDLIDELVFQWLQEPPFQSPTPLVLANVGVPLGFGPGLEALVENHFIAVLNKNPRSNVQLAHCPQCTALVVRSGKEGTVVARGFDQPEVISKLGATSGAQHAIFLDFEAEGAALVLRVRVTRLEPALPIVYGKTISTTTSSPALLRSAERLKSAADARKEYLEILEGRGLITVPVKLGIRAYGVPEGMVSTIPMVWLTVGLELALSQARAWTAALNASFSWQPEGHVAYSVQGRFSRLLSGSVTSLTRPDFYGFFQGSVISVHGTTALSFRADLPTPNDLRMATGVTPQMSFAAFGTGVEMRVKNRIGLAVYFEWAPWLDFAPAVGNFLDVSPFFKIHTIGVEVSFCF